MKGRKNFSGQIQTMGKGGINEMPTSNPMQKNLNYNNPLNYGVSSPQPIYQMNNQNQMPMPINMPMPMNMNMNMNIPVPIQQNNPMMYNNNMMQPINNMNNYMPAQNYNRYTPNSMENRNNRNININNMNNKNNNNPMIRNAKYIISNNNNNINNRQKARSAKRYPDENKSNNHNNYVSQNYNYIEFHPYTLKDYKELTRNKVVMGPLGANIGTKEWELKRNKMKKMQDYSNNINKEHKGIKSLKKETPSDEIEKLTKQKIENSIRYRTYEYGKLVRAGGFKDDSNKFNPNKNLDIIPENDDDYYLKKYEEQLKKETDDMNKPKPKKNEPVAPVVEEEKEEGLDLDQLLRQKEAYKVKIQGIRDSLLD